jgi:hypothetical protein
VGDTVIREIPHEGEEARKIKEGGKEGKREGKIARGKRKKEK